MRNRPRRAVPGRQIWRVQARIGCRATVITEPRTSRYVPAAHDQSPHSTARNQAGRRAGLRIVGSLSSPDARRQREFAARNRLPHVWVDPTRRPGAVLGYHGLSPDDTPVVVMRGGEALRNLSYAGQSGAATDGSRCCSVAAARSSSVRRIRRNVTGAATSAVSPVTQSAHWKPPVSAAAAAWP